MNNHNLHQKNRRVAIVAGLVVLIMLGLSFASVPLYNLFCRVTGFGGTTQVAARGAARVIDRDITVRFDASTSPDLPWTFEPEQRSVTLKLGQDGVMVYKTKNISDQPIAGTAIYNVTPLKAGKYFNKIQCFCFGEQVLQPGEAVDMPVLFFVDPALDEDPNLAEVKTITLSYTFFKTESEALEDAMETFYTTEEGGS